jgi:Ca-activated chloride channel family protein
VWWTFISLAEMLPPLLLAVVILILANPQRTGPPQQKRAVTNIEFVVDVSGSMMAQYGDGTRYDGSMKAIDQFLSFRKGDSFGLMFFGDANVQWVPITSDPSAIRCAPPFMRPDVAPDAFGGTAIGKALRASKKHLEKTEEGDRMILLVTDGQSFDLGGGEDAAIAKELKDANITVFCVLASNEEPQSEVVSICHATGGESFGAEDPGKLDAVFRKIDRMKLAKITPTFVETLDYYEPFALVGIALLALNGLLWFGLRYSPW